MKRYPNLTPVQIRIAGRSGYVPADEEYKDVLTMGDGRIYRCNRCGHEEQVSSGIGFMFPQLYQDVVTKIRKGKYGREWKEVFESRPGAAVDARTELYVCPECGNCVQDLNLSLYEPMFPDAGKKERGIFSSANPAEGIEYVMPMELEREYRRIRIYVHRCPECKTRMDQYRTGGF